MFGRLRWLAAGALAVGLVASSTSVGASGFGSTVYASGELSDLLPAANATDGAEARLTAIALGDETRFYLVVTGLDPASAGTTYGAHIHVGPCVAGNGAAAGPHYNTGAGGISTETEVWLDFTVRAGGFAVSRTTVPFVIESGDAQALIIHALPTAPVTGVAGARIACLPVEF